MEPGNGKNRPTGSNEAGGPTTHQWINTVTKTTRVAYPITRQRFEKEKNKHIYSKRGQSMTREPTKLFSAKHPTIIGVWNVRKLHQSGKFQRLATELDRYNIEILGLSECRWNTSGMTILPSGNTLVYSGNPNKDDIHDNRVGFMLTKKAARALLEWNPV